MTLSLQELTRIGKIADLRTKRRIDTVQQDLFVRMQTRRNILKCAVRRQQIGCCIGERAEFLHNLRKEILRYQVKPKFIILKKNNIRIFNIAAV